MSEGIIERLEFKIDQLTEMVRLLASGGSTAAETAGFTPVLDSNAEKKQETTVDTVQNTPTVTNDAVNVELDSTGCEWIAEIHAKAKTKTAKGVWKLTRGIDKDLAKKLIAENIAKNKAAAPTDASATNMPGTTAPTGNMPGMPGTTAPTDNMPGVAVQDFKQLCVQIINKLVSEYGVSYESLTEVYETLGATEFEQIPVTEYENLQLRLGHWCDALCNVDKEIRGILTIDPVNGQIGIDNILQGYGVNNIKDVHFEEVKNLLSQVVELHQQWQEFRKQNPVT